MQARIRANGKDMHAEIVTRWEFYSLQHCVDQKEQSRSMVTVPKGGIPINSTDRIYCESSLYLQPYSFAVLHLLLEERFMEFPVPSTIIGLHCNFVVSEMQNWECMSIVGNVDASWRICQSLHWHECHNVYEYEPSSLIAITTILWEKQNTNGSGPAALLYSKFADKIARFPYNANCMSVLIKFKTVLITSVMYRLNHIPSLCCLWNLLKSTLTTAPTVKV